MTPAANHLRLLLAKSITYYFMLLDTWVWKQGQNYATH